MRYNIDKTRAFITLLSEKSRYVISELQVWLHRKSLIPSYELKACLTTLYQMVVKDGNI